MRRICLGFVVAAAVLIALPATARGLRADSFSCLDDPTVHPICWNDVPVGTPYPALPLGLPPSISPNYLVAAAVTPARPFMDFFTPSVSPNFDFVAFYYGDFLAGPPAISPFPPVGGPFISQGLLRDGSGNHPLFRITWNLDDSLLGRTDIFLPYQNNPSDPGDPFHVGVQLVFGLDPDTFQLNGFNNASPTAYQYSADMTCAGIQCGPFIWYGALEPCDTFNISDGRCAGLSAVPEPNSIALLGLGFLALVIGLRTGRPARMHLA